MPERARQRLDNVLTFWGSRHYVPLYSESGLGRHIIHTGHDVHHSGRVWLRQDGLRYPTARTGLGWGKRYTPGPFWLYLKRHLDTIHRTPLGVLHTHDQLGGLREVDTVY